MWMYYVLLYIGMWAFTSVLAAVSHKQDPKSYIVWDTEDFVFVGFFWFLFLPPLLVRQAVRFWANR